MPTKKRSLAAHSLAVQAEGREVFTFLTLRWDVDAASALVEGRQTNAYLNPKDYQKGTGQLIGTNDAHYMDTDLARPIIIAQYKAKRETEPMKLPIDGWHRIRKAAELGFERLNAHLLTLEESEAVRFR